MFVQMMPRVRTSDDAAAHLDYLPARGREVLSYGDEVLCAQVPHMAVGSDLIPDAGGTLTRTEDLKPLDFGIALDEAESAHKDWISSPNTGSDVPHWQCYTSPQRVARLRQIFAAANGAPLDATEADLKRTLAAMSKRGLLSWLREWAEGDDPVSAASALRLVCRQRSRLPEVERAKVIPTTDGLRTLQDKNVVFLHQLEGLKIEDGVFVDPAFLSQSGVDKLLRGAGFRALDPLAILNAHLARLSPVSSEEEHAKLWQAAVEVPLPTAQKALAAYSSLVKVPTRDGDWAWPREVIDIDIPVKDVPGVKALDRARCLAGAAHTLGVVHDPVREYPSEDELYFEKYRDWILEDINANQGPGERPVERIELYPGVGPGPFSMLYILRDADAPLQLRAQWTAALVQADNGDWTCDDLDTGMSYNVHWSPVRWAVDNAGIVNSTRGFRPPSKVVAPSLLRYELLLPLLRSGGSQLAAALDLPNELEAVPAEVLREALGADLFNPRIPNAVLLDFILAVSRIAYPDAQPPAIPAKVGQITESRSPSTVYLATTDEQETFLKSRQRPYLRVADEQVSEFVESVGCRRFEDTFAFSILVEGEQDEEPIVDVFPGLRTTYISSRLKNATMTRAVQVVKLVTTEEGVEPQSLEWHLDGLRLIVRNVSDERRLLRFVNEAFELGLTNADLEQVLKVGLDHQLEEERQRAKAAATDAERLDVYFGPDDLREALPKGLWQALKAQGLVDGNTSVAELFLTVYRDDSVEQLAQNFRDRRFPDVPTKWAGSPTTIGWLRKMGFGPEFAGRRNQRQDQEFVVPGAVRLNPLHDFQETISEQLRDVLTRRTPDGGYQKAMVELPTGAGKTRVATETVLRLFTEDHLRGSVLWIAQSQELCEQAVQTASTVWRGLGDERPLTIGRLWDGNTVSQPDTEFSFIVATDAQLRLKIGDAEYEWLSEAAAVFIDEGHRAGDSELYTRILNWLGVAGRGFARPLVGLSATPFKGTSIQATDNLARRFGRHKIKAFEGNAYRELAARGVLARVQHRILEGINVRLEPSEQNDAKTLRRVSPTVLDRIGSDHARMSTLVNHIMSLDSSWPVLVFTPNVLSAQVLAATLRYRGITAAAVSGQTSRRQRRESIKQFKNNEIRVLTNCDLLIQGFDAPGVRALYIARPTFSPNAYIQMAGRGLRGPENGGKDECLIVDMADNFGDVTDLLGYKEYEDLWQEHRS